MLNVNSPTVQAMMNSLPQGVGNMPVYFGNTPTTMQETQPIFSGTPYPSPKEMLMQSANNNIYAPTSFAPNNNIIGGYNPGFAMAFNGYSNPYMTTSYINPYYVPTDYETWAVANMALCNGIQYEEQLQMDSAIYKTMSRIASINMNRSEEEIKKREAIFDVYDRRKTNAIENPFNKPAIKMKHIIIEFCDGREMDIDPNKTLRFTPQFMNRTDFYDMLSQRCKIARENMQKTITDIHNNSIERAMDNVDLVDFFNECIGSIISRDMDTILRRQLITNNSFMYNKNKFKENLLNNNGCKSRSQMTAIERFTGRYGVMPDGRPVSPGHDPSIAESFTYDQRTGQITISPPNFIANRMELARNRFIQSISK